MFLQVRDNEHHVTEVSLIRFKLILILHAESSVNLESDILLRQFKNSDPSNWVKHETIK